MATRFFISILGRPALRADGPDPARRPEQDRAFILDKVGGPWRTGSLDELVTERGGGRHSWEGFVQALDGHRPPPLTGVYEPANTTSRFRRNR